MSSLILAGDTSGAITLTVPTAAGTNTITLPAVTGTAITTASTSGIPNTINWTTVQTSSVSPAVAGTGYPMNTTSGALTVTLPAAPTAGQIISIVDYAGTAATNNITINPNGNRIQASTLNRVLNTNREAINLVYVDSTQGWLAYSDVYSTTAPLPLEPYTASYLVVAGGGGGGEDRAGGGGAGGYVTGTISLTVGTTYTATVGGGGAGGNFPLSRGNQGTNSSFPGVTTAVGGGGGSAGAPSAGTLGSSGGSGGGGGSGNNTAGLAGTPGQGSAGGNGTPSVNGAGGGGGSSSVGSAGTSGGGGNGGSGTANTITGSSVVYAGGGGGGKDSSGTQGIGGPGTPGVSGGNGQVGTTPLSSNTGVVNTGGGGGGGGGINNVASGLSSAGGSGVVILSVPTARYSGTTTGSPTITTSGANTIIRFTGSGTYTA